MIPLDLLQRLIHSLTPDRVLLFGSRARGLARPGSDIDLLLVGAWNMEPGLLLRHARLLVRHSFPRVDLVLCTPEEIAAAEAGHAPFLLSILDSSVVIYQR
jgi:predicted nucleotidyltransferase